MTDGNLLQACGSNRIHVTERFTAAVIPCSWRLAIDAMCPLTASLTGECLGWEGGSTPVKEFPDLPLARRPFYKHKRRFRQVKEVQA